MNNFFYFMFFFIICILSIVKLNHYPMIHLFCLTLISFIYYAIRSYLEMDAMTKAKPLAKEYIEEYLRKYSGIKNYMENIDIEAKDKGYVTTMFGRRRNIPELKSSNFMVRQFGSRAALNMPIQGTAADIMKMAMIEVNKKLEEKNLKSRIVLQVHDELLLEVPKEEKEKAIEILKTSMENVVKLTVPLISEVSI